MSEIVVGTSVHLTILKPNGLGSCCYVSPYLTPIASYNLPLRG
jgi:hypothetical protein